MKKYLILSSLLALTACAGGGESSLLSYAKGINNEKTAVDVPQNLLPINPTFIVATPDDVKLANSAVTNMDILGDFSDRIVEVYRQSGLDYSNLNDTDFADSDYGLEVTPGLLTDIYNNMSDDKKRKLREAAYIQHKIDYVYMAQYDDSLSDEVKQILPDVVKWINAFYYVESNGQIKQILNPAEIANIKTPTDLAAFIEPADLKHQGYYDVLRFFDHDVFSVNESTGIIEEWENGHNRVGDTSEFCGFGDCYMYNSYGDFLTHGDLGMKIINDKIYRPTVIRGVSQDISLNDMVGKIYPISWDFTGRAIGTYTKDNNVSTPSYKFLQTDNATMHIDGNKDNITYVINLPFSDSGWYDVKLENNNINEYGSKTIEFSNYAGDDSNKLSIDDGSSKINADGWESVSFLGNYTFQPTEAVGIITWGNYSNEEFQAAYGMVKQE